MKNVRLIVGLLLLIVGLTFILIPLYYEWQQKKELSALEEALALISDNGDADQVSTIENLSLNEEQLKNIMELEIPSIKLELKVLDETTEENLNIALTQLKANQTPGTGNFAIAGHRGYRKGRFFNQLPNVSIGDPVFLHTSTQTFEYRVKSVEVIEPSYVEILDDHADKKEITMITCTKSGEKRYAVVGELININDKK